MLHWLTWIGPAIACALVLITRELGWVAGGLCTALALLYARYLDVKHPITR